MSLIRHFLSIQSLFHYAKETFCIVYKMLEMKEHEPSSAPSPANSHCDLTFRRPSEGVKAAPSPATSHRDLTFRGPSEGVKAVSLSDAIQFEVKSIIGDDQQINKQRNKLTNRSIIGLSVAITLFGLLCVAVGVAIVYLHHWIQFDSGMSKYAYFHGI